jgi:hypothetical protein
MKIPRSEALGFNVGYAAEQDEAKAGTDKRTSKKEENLFGSGIN